MEKISAKDGVRTFLHVGCGTKYADRIPMRFRSDEWQEVRLDIDPQVEPDIVADIRDLSQLPTAAYDAVFSPHNIEHLRYHEVDMALQSFHRVLKPGGLMVLLAPNLRRVAEFIVNNDLDTAMLDTVSGPIAPVDVLYGFRPWIREGNEFMIHKTGFTPELLFRRLTDNGFQKIVVMVASAEIPREHPFNMVALAYKA